MPEPPEGRDLLLEIDVQGAEQVMERCEDVCCILVVPPSPEEAEARLRGRGDSEAHIRRRMEMAAHEVEVGRKIADHVIVNDDIQRAVEELAQVVEAFRAARGR